MTTLDQDAPARLKPCIGDRILLTRPAPPDGVQAFADVWQERREKPSLVIDVTAGWVHAILVGGKAHEAWSAPPADVEVIGRATYPDSARERAQRLVEAESELVGLRAQVAALTEERVEQDYRLELAEQVVRQMQDLYPPRVYLPGAAEPARAEPIGESRTVLRNAVFAVGTGYVYRQMHEDEWYAAHLSHSVFSWEQVLGDGPCIEVTNPAGVGRLFDVLIAHRQRERDVQSVMWTFERDIDHAARSVGCEPDRHPAGSIEEFRAIIARAHLTISRLYSRVEARKA